MKTSKTLIVFAAFASSILTQSCTAQPETKDSTIIQSEKNEIEAEKLRQQEKEIEAQFEEFRKKINQDIEENEKAIAVLKEKSKKIDKKNKKEYDESIESLEKQNKTLREKANSYKRTVGQNWDEFQKEFNSDLAKFGQALKDFTTKNDK
jgi:signal transduction protein with GAF and PtsI domain